MMKELIVRVSGSVQESNLDSFKESALEFIGNIKTELVTDDDFADASENVKACKDAESKLSKTIDDVLNQTDDVRNIITTLSEIQGQLKKTRLNLDKQVKSEKEKRKNESVKNGVGALTTIYSNSDISFHLGTPDKSIVLDVVKGKKTIKGMDEAVVALIESEKERINGMVDNFHSNLALIGDADIQSLFHDREKLALKTESEVRSEIKARETQYQLEQKEKEEKERVEREKEAEKVVSVEEPAQQEIAPEPKIAPPPVEEPKNDIPEPPSLPSKSAEQKHVITAVVSGGENLAVKIARYLNEVEGVESVKLERF